jgi:hypothetical protein
MSANGISHLSTKEQRQKAKLALAAAKRSATGRRHTLDITELPTQYSDNNIIDNDNGDNLLEGRPWTSASAFTFYESFGTTNSLSTTQYVAGNKIYVYSSTFDVIGFQPAKVIVNGITVLTAGTGTRGHNLVILNPLGDVVSTANYDTYSDSATLTALASALNGVASGNTVVLTVYDASALNGAVRTALAANYGSTNSNTWTSSRVDHIFIGIKV